LWKEAVQYAASIVLARLHFVQVPEPEMVEIPEGTYQRGDMKGSTDEKGHVTIKRFKIGKYEVTFHKYDRYLELAGG
jgi:formylglycine-generating enzyme required for sulfatase activity